MRELTIGNVRSVVVARRKRNNRSAIIKQYSDGVISVVCYARHLFKNASRASNMTEAFDIAEQWLKGI